MDLRYKPVSCCQCGKKYTCTPATDYFFFADMPEEFKADWTGYCWACFTGSDRPEPGPGDPEFIITE